MTVRRNEKQAPARQLTPSAHSMRSNRRHLKSRLAAAGAFALMLMLGALGTLLVGPGSAGATGANLNQLNSQLGAVQAHSQSLSDRIAGLRSQISALGRQITLVQTREAEVRTTLVSDQARLATAHMAVVREQAVVDKLQAELARARMILRRQLVSSYENSQPDLVSVVLNAHGFSQLLDQLNYLSSAETQQQTVIRVTQMAKERADAATVRLDRLQAADMQATDAAETQVRALAGMNAFMHSRQTALGHAQAAEQTALAASQSRGAQLQRAIARIQAEQAAAAQAAAMQASAQPSGPTLGSSGGWAIPYAIVMCESGGQDLPPNSAGASGYYQIIPGTWRLFGGTGPAAYLAPKAEQDAVASRIWAGGAGASNWVCAGIVGIH